jgi:hypothetical protein
MERILLQVPYLGDSLPTDAEVDCMARTRVYAKKNHMRHVIISNVIFPCDEFIDFALYLKDNPEFAQELDGCAFQDGHRAQLMSDMVRFYYARKHANVLYVDRDAVPPEDVGEKPAFARYGTHGIDQCVFYSPFPTLAGNLYAGIMRNIPVINGKKMVLWPTIHAAVNELCLGKVAVMAVEHLHMSRAG